MFHRFINSSLRPFHRHHQISLSSSINSAPKIKSLLICGPSGVGKGTLINLLLTNYPNKFGLSVSRTSRKPRVGEIDGVHYHFVKDRETFHQDIQNGKHPYIEYAEVHGNFYGTRQDAVEDVHKAGKICILDLDTKGAENLKKMKFPIRSIFIAPPSIESLKNRLTNRGTETEAQMNIRLHNAIKEIEYGHTPGNFDMILVNDDLNSSYHTLTQQLRVWFPEAITSSESTI